MKNATKLRKCKTIEDLAKSGLKQIKRGTPFNPNGPKKSRWIVKDVVLVQLNHKDFAVVFTNRADVIRGSLPLQKTWGTITAKGVVHK